MRTVVSGYDVSRGLPVILKYQLLLLYGIIFFSVFLHAVD